MTRNDDTCRPAAADLAGLFRRASRLMARAYHRRDHARHAQHHALSIIVERGTMPQSELLEILDVRSSSLSEILGKLERQGMVSRERSAEDRRSFVVSATPEGTALFDDPDDGGVDANSLFACLDETERAQFQGILTKLIKALSVEATAESGCGPHGRGWGRGGCGMGKRGGRGRGGPPA